MAITKSTTTLLSVASIAFGQESALGAGGSALEITNASLLAVSAKVTYAAGATVGAEVRLYSDEDGTDYDTDPFYSESFPRVVSNATKKESRMVTPRPGFLKASVKNPDPTYAITNVVVKATVQQVA